MSERSTGGRGPSAPLPQRVKGGMRGTTGHSFSSLSLDLRMSSVNSEIQEMDRDNETHPFIEQNKDGKRFVADVETPQKCTQHGLQQEE